MKTILNLLIVGSLFLLAGCHKITVGYLFTDEAEYSPKEMEISNINLKLAEMEAKLARFNEEAGVLQEDYDRLNAVLLALEAKKDSLNGIIHPIMDSIEKVLDPVKEANKIEALQQRLEEELYPARAVISAECTEAEAKVREAELGLQQLADRLGMQSAVITRAEIDVLKNRIKYGIPWLSSNMEGIMGTEPLLYEIVEVKGDDPAEAAKLRDNMTIIGGGKICVEQDFEVAPGRYPVTVRVSNEGRSKVFEEAFTFVVVKPGE